MIDNIQNNFILKTITPFFKEQAESCYIVGGFLRDCLLNREICDVDIVVPQNTAESTAKRLADFINGYFVELDNVNNIYRVVFEDKINYVDIADCTGSCIEEDLKRRDFTINAIAYDLKKQKLIDINSGLEDLKKGIIREISELNITDDPIRILRAFRFQSELGFNFSDELKEIIKKHCLLIKNPAKERVNTELIKLFDGKYADGTLTDMENFGILEQVFPFVKDLKKVPPNSHHHLGLLEHSIETVKQVQLYYENAVADVKSHLDETLFAGHKRIAYLKLGAFLHDTGKPSVWTIDTQTGRHRFIMHDSEGAKIIEPYLKDLKFSKKQISYLQKIIKNHIYPAGVVTSDETSEKAYLRFYRKMGDETIDLIAIAYADRMSALGPEITQEMINKNINGLDKLLNGYLKQKTELKPLPKLLDGKEIMQILNIPQSKELGKIIEKLKEAQISSDVITKEDAINFIKNLP